MKDIIYVVKQLCELIGKPTRYIVPIGTFIVFFECFWALLYTIKSFWSWGYIAEEIGLLFAAYIVGSGLVAFIGAFYMMYKESKESEKNTVE